MLPPSFSSRAWMVPSGPASENRPTTSRSVLHLAKSALRVVTSTRMICFMLFFRSALGAILEIALDERIERAVEDRLDVAGLVAGAMVLDHLVRLGHVGAGLGGPRGLAPGAGGLVFLLVPLLS